MVSPSSRRIVIEPLTRVEGHGKVTILLDESHRVQSARLHIVEFRGFERFIQGRPFWELPVLVQRLCGICPVSHHLCAAKAVDGILGIDQLTPAGEKMRRLMHYGQIFQSHALHFFYLAAPDLLFGFDAPVAKRNIVGVIQEHPGLALQGVKMRQFGQEVIRATAGKKIHGTGAIPGGINKSLSLPERDSLLADLDPMLAWSREAVALARDYTLRNFEELAGFGSFDSNHVALVRADGAMDLYDGKLSAVDRQGATILDQVDPQDYLTVVAEEVRPWSYMKFPYLKQLGAAEGWFRVGPLARLNVCSFIGTPEAEAARSEFFAAVGGRPCHMTMAYHWARMIELLHAAEVIAGLLHDADLQSDDRVAPAGARRSEYVAMLEAPRGALTHHYKVDENDLVTMANLIVSTTCNNEAMNQAVGRIAEQQLAGRAEISEGLLNSIEVGIRAYDPCLSCATHAIGQMPLEVTLVDGDGSVLDRRARPS
ncbi:MAG: Ni/Fe hydrogenase subunit alpha [Thermoanaerobaculia bacterium]|nr:Ni/Fe hydrogenase subunit alpha [Thermoanaerobaculia bacterium]MBP9823327.1 Ni/Fe hydrogenase subunit alpha [Thermoanaerobaculia bacterium]